MKKITLTKMGAMLLMLVWLLGTKSAFAEQIHYFNFNSDVPAENVNWANPINANIGNGTLSFNFENAVSFGGSTENGNVDEVTGGSFVPQGGTETDGVYANNGKYLELAVSSEEYENLIVSYASRRTGTGFTTKTVEYSVNGTDWTLLETIDVTALGSTWTIYNLDFTAIDAVDNTAGFAVRVTLDGASSTSGNIRFDNISVEGDPIPTDPPIMFSEDFSELFNFSIANANVPDWLTGSNNRGLAIFEDNLYVANLAGNVIRVLDPQTGDIKNSISLTGVIGGLQTLGTCDLEVDEEGELLIGNLASDGGETPQEFRVYSVDGSVASLVLSFPIPNGSGRLGDKFTVRGKLSDKSAVLFAVDAKAGNLNIYRFSMLTDPQDAILFGAPEVITLGTSTGGSAKVAPVPDGGFYFTGNGVGVSKLNADGSLVGTISTGLIAGGSTSLEYVTKDGNDDIIAVYDRGANSERVRLVRVIDGDPSNINIFFSSPIMNNTVDNPNANGTGDITVSELAQGVYNVYVLGTSVGISGYTNLDIEEPSAMAQIIHNSADAAAAVVDVYVNGVLALEDFAFRTATPFIELPAEDPIELVITAPDAGIAAPVATFTPTLVEGETYVIIANGLIPAPDKEASTEFNIFPYAPARMEASVATNTDVLVFHGSTDAPDVSIWAGGETPAELIPSLAYGDFSNYLELTTADYVLEIRSTDGLETFVSYEAPLSTLTLEGEAISVVASGFINPDPVKSEFGLFVALASGGALVALPEIVNEIVINEFPYLQDFEGANFPPDGWTILDEDGSSTIWESSTAHNITPGGTTSARHLYGGSSAGNQIGFLITPAIELPSDIDHRIKFWSRNIYPSDYGKNSVLISTGSPDPVDGDYVEVWSPTSVENLWSEQSLSLADYTGQTIYVAFRYEGDFAHTWHLDDVLLEVAPNTFAVTFNVTDESDVPVENAVITLNGNANEADDYVFADIEPGTYDYSVVAPLFDPFEGEATVVDADVTVDVTLVAGVPELAADPDNLNVGYAVNGMTSTSAIVTVTNIGFAPAEIADGDITLSGTNAADFSFALVDELLTYPITLENAESIEIEVSYTPTSAVEASAQLVVASNATEDLVVELIAVGYDPLTQFFDNFDTYEGGISTSPWDAIAQTDGTGSFADISTAGTAYSGALKVRIANGNNAAGDVMLISPMVTDLDVSWVRFYAKMGVSSQTENLVVGYLTDPEDPTTFVSVETIAVTGAYQQYVVSFADVDDPTSLPENAYIAFRHNFGATFRVYLVDDVAYEPVPDTPVLSVSSDEVNFGDAVYLNETVLQNVVITNTGIGTITLNEVDFTITGADAASFDMIFTDDVTLPVDLGTAESYTLTLTFTPTAEVVYTAALDIEDNLVTKGITTVSLTGTGYDPTVSPVFVYDFVGDFPPLDWANLTGALSDDTALTPGTLWVHGFFAGNDALPEENAARVNIWSTRDAWLVSPPIDLGDGSTPYMLSFDMALNAYNTSDPGELENKQVAVLISTDNGATWTPADIVRQWNDGDVISNSGQKEVIDLSSYSDVVKIAFYGKSWAGGSDVDLYITNVAVEEAVYQTLTFNVTDNMANPITDAMVTFNGEMVAAAPYVFDAVEGTYEYEVTRDGFQPVSGMVTVADVAVDVDVEMSPVYAVDFTVTDFDTTPIADATISITGDAEAELMTDVDGLAAIDLTDGVYDVVVSAEGYVEQSLQITVSGAPVSEEITLGDELAAPFNLMVDVTGVDALLSWNTPFAPSVFFDSFEDETFDAWFATVQGPGTPGEGGTPSWHIGPADGLNPPDGNSVARVDWGFNIDTWLISPLLMVEETTSMSFQWNSSYFWSVDPNPNAELMVKVSPDGENWTEIWNWQDIGVWENWAWYQTVLELDEFVGQELHFAFQLVANDNGNTEIDQVTFGPAGKAGTFMASAVPQGVKKDSRVNTYVATEKALIDFTVLLNGAEVATGLTETNYQFTGLPYGTHTAGVAANYSSGTSDTTYIDFAINLPVVDPVPMAMLYDATGENLPAEIGSGGNARAAALYQDRYVIVPSREIGSQVWAFDMINPHLEPMALDMGTDIVVGGLFPVSYIEIVGDDIYVSNMSTSSTEASPFRVYRWNSLDAAPELVLSSDGGWGRLGDAFTIIGDPAADGSIVAHINSDPGENELRRMFRKFDFVGGVIQNEDAPELVEVTLPDEVGTMNSYGVMKAIENETDKFLVTSNAIGMAIVDESGSTLAYIGTDVFPSRTMDANIFYFGGNRYLSFVVNKEWETLNGDYTAAYYQVVDITLGATVEEAISLISTPQDLINRTVHFDSIGNGTTWLGGTNRVVKSGDDLLVLSHVVDRGFKLVTSGAVPASYTLTVEAAPAESGTVTGGGDYYEGATVPVTATPADDFQFVNWTVGDTEVSTDAEFDYTMPGEATTLVANFEPIPVTDVATLAELRGLPSDGSRYRYTGDAVIVAMDGFRNRKFLQDETAAIMIDDNGGTITTEYDLYDEITNVTGFTTVFRNLLQFVPLENTAEATANTPVDPVVFALDAVTQDDQAKLIKFMNVTFVGVEPDSLFSNGTNYTLTDGTNTFVLRTDFWNTDLFESEIPTVPVNVTGVVITFNETLQIVPRMASDIEEYVPGFDVTFNVDMTPATGFDPAADMVYITGSMFTWAAPGDDPDNQTMTRVDDSMIWTTTLKIEEGTYEYKYFINAGWAGGEWEGEPNRSVTVDGDMVVNNVWADLVNVNDMELANINLYPNPARDYFHITAATAIRSIVISDITGKIVYNNIINDSQVRIQNEFETGIYILHIHTDEGVAVRKLQIQK